MEVDRYGLRSQPFGPLTPLPVIGTCTGLPGALVTIFSIADSANSSEGLYSTLIWYLCGHGEILAREVAGAKSLSLAAAHLSNIEPAIVRSGPA
jgi:hypothetical protein